MDLSIIIWVVGIDIDTIEGDRVQLWKTVYVLGAHLDKWPN